jgi:dethiobiotin synthetase
VNAVFITGTDTGIGKTRVARALLRALARTGARTVGMKPVAAGIPEGAAEHEDVRALAQAGTLSVPPEVLCPYAFAPAIAPHLAAAQAGREITIEPLAAAFRQLATGADWVVVEGAGGVLVPINAREDLLDFARAMRLPVLLVVGMRLGCLNHALLSTLAIQVRGLQFAGWVANFIDSDMAEPEANLAFLETRLGSCLARFAYLSVPGQVECDVLDSNSGDALLHGLKQRWGAKRI